MSRQYPRWHHFSLPGNEKFTAPGGADPGRNQGGRVTTRARRPGGSIVGPQKFVGWLAGGRAGPQRAAEDCRTGRGSRTKAGQGAKVRAAPYTHPWVSNATAGTRRLFCSADFQVCRIAGFQTRWRHRKLAHSTLGRPADLEIGDTAGWKPAVRLAQAACKVPVLPHSQKGWSVRLSHERSGDARWVLIGISWVSNAAAGTRRLFGSADFQVCGIAGFQTRWRHRKLAHSILGRPADLEIGDTAGWKPAVRLAQAACKVQGPWASGAPADRHSNRRAGPWSGRAGLANGLTGRWWRLSPPDNCGPVGAGAGSGRRSGGPCA